MRKPMESKDNKKIKDNKIIEENKEIKETQKNKEYRVFQIDEQDNVATALEEIPGVSFARVIGDHPAGEDRIKALEEIPEGHKIALRAIAKDAPVILDYLCEECSDHFETLKKYLTNLGGELGTHARHEEPV